MAALAAGCAANDPRGYDTFDEWAVGDIEVYQLDRGAESRPQVYRMLYGPVLAVPLAAYDVGRIAASPFVWTYYAGRGLGGGPADEASAGATAGP